MSPASVVMTAGGAEHPFAQGCRVAVVVEKRRYAEVVGEPLYKREIGPLRNVGSPEDHAEAGVEGARGCDANGEYGLSCRPDGFNQRLEAIVGTRLAGERKHTIVRYRFRNVRNELRGPQVRAADIDRNDPAHVTDYTFGMHEARAGS